jgi:guanylate kinase
MGRFVILSGPSCVGKGPLHTALARWYPELEAKLEKLILYNSRAPRPGEKDGVDYHFRSREEISALRGQGFIVLDVRGDLQALDLQDLQDILAGEKDGFFEGNPYVPLQILGSSLLAEAPKVTVFLSPLSKAEILFLKAREIGPALPNLVTDVMRRKLLRRTRYQKHLLSLKDLENVERRASSAYREMQLAWHFDHVIPNHDGEDSENWQAFYYPLGDAWKAVHAFAAILRGEDTPYAERWGADLLPEG